MLDQNTVFYVNAINSVFFDGMRLTSLPENTNLDKMEKLMREDKILNDLINKYFVASTIAKSLYEKEKELQDQIGIDIMHTFISDYKELASKTPCTEIRKMVRDSMVDYIGNNVLLTTTVKKYDFSCLIKEIDNAVKQIDPTFKFEISHDKKSIAFFTKNGIVYVTDRFALRDVLSYLRNLVNENKIGDFVKTLKELDSILDKRGKAIDLFLDIALRVKELALKSVE